MEKPQDLNSAQWQAVTYDGGHLLIAAGPGTGKTHTLTRRIAHVCSGDVFRGHVPNSKSEFGTCPQNSRVPSLKPDEKILAITFTNKAARQMQERLTDLGVPPARTFVGTFHAFCLRLLRDFRQETALPPNFKVVVPEDIQSFDKAVLERISLMKSSRLVITPDEDYKVYQRYLRKNGCIDFDDILREALDLLDQEHIAQQLRRVYRHIFVDEYQDSNIVQNALLKKLAGDTVCLTAIGDPNQSIYGFRGGSAGFFGRFPDDFPGARILALQENYRSAPNLLAASSQVMGGVEILAKLNVHGKLITHSADSDRAEADYVASQITKMVGGMDMLSARSALRSFGDIAVLYRLNSQRHVIAQALDHLGIPYQMSSKAPKSQSYSDEAVLGHNEEVLEYDVEKVSLLTLHAAKGLEFPVVFIIGCEANLLPLDLEGMHGDLQEERRLFYVGMTRAKEHLYLTCARRRQIFGKTWQQQPSPFLSDIEEELKAYETTRLRKKAKSVIVNDSQMKLF